MWTTCTLKHERHLLFNKSKDNLISQEITDGCVLCEIRFDLKIQIFIHASSNFVYLVNKK